MDQCLFQDSCRLDLEGGILRDERPKPGGEAFHVKEAGHERDLIDRYAQKPRDELDQGAPPQSVIEEHSCRR